MQLFPQRTADLRRYKFINWQTVVVESVERQFKAVVAQAEIARHTEKLYVSQDRPSRQIQLFFGQHPAGTVPGGTGLAVEGGATLVLSQGATGAVAVFLYPYESELSRRREKLIVWGVFDDPLEITKRVLSRAIADFTCYARVSSVLDGGSPADIRCVNRLLKRDKFQSRIKVDAVKLAEEEAQAKKEKTASWGARLVNHPLYVLFALFGTIITVTTGWPLFIEQLHALGGKTSPSSSQAPVATMPVITGWYTFCQPDDSGASSNMLNLLYDIEQYAGKVVFFDVQVRVDCVMGGAYDPTAPLSRMVEDHSLTYSFGHQATGRARASVDGGRDSARLYRFLPENGSLVHVLGDPDGRNALTNLGINIEGADDELYGPYLIKARQDDAVLTLELSVPTLDSAMQASAYAVAQQRRIAHENDPPPIGLPKPIPLNAEDLRRYKELSASSATPTVHGVPLPNTLPPVDAMSFDKQPLPPLPPPHPASLKH